MNIGELSFEQYRSRVEAFHGYAAPGLLLGGYMVEMAKRGLPRGVLYDAVSETKSCLPDAVQLLTPCTVGNGWLKIMNLGRYALTLYDKHLGDGVRVWMDPDKLEAWPAIKDWFFILIEKSRQDSERLIEEIRTAGDSVLSCGPVRMRAQELVKKHKGRVGPCPVCREAYPLRDGAVCRGCQGEAPYEDKPDTGRNGQSVPGLRSVPARDALHRALLHDMTEVLPGESKGPAYHKEQLLEEEDIGHLGRMGKVHVFVKDEALFNAEDWAHEDEAAEAFARAMAGEGVEYRLPPREGKLVLTAARDGLFMLTTQRLEAFNLTPGVMCASRPGFSRVERGMRLAGVRAVPLYLPRTNFFQALSAIGETPICSVLPLRPAKVGILVTGNEVYQGVIEDRFIPIITAKVRGYACEVVKSLIAPDDCAAIGRAVGALREAGAELIITTAGLSVDPDDVTRRALEECGLQDELYGLPVMPGGMTLLGRMDGIRILGVPACALYFKTTGFDLLLPRVLAQVPVTRHDLARMGEGGLCLECKTCTYPKCSFGT